MRIEALAKDNFDTWKLQVRALLVKNDAWDYVSGEKVKPEIVQGDVNAASIAAAHAWDVADRKAHSDLVLAIQPSELKQIKGCETAHSVWVKLHSIYQSKGPARKAAPFKETNIAQDGGRGRRS